MVIHFHFTPKIVAKLLNLLQINFSLSTGRLHCGKNATPAAILSYLVTTILSILLQVDSYQTSVHSILLLLKVLPSKKLSGRVVNVYCVKV